MGNLIKEYSKKMKKLTSIIITVSISFFLIGGCGGNGSSDEPCDFDIFSVTNGTEINNNDSFWDCESIELGDFDFALFENGEGLSPNIDDFVWEEIGCRSISIQAETLNAIAVGINFSNNLLTFILESDTPGLEESDVSCELVQL